MTTFEAGREDSPASVDQAITADVVLAMVREAELTCAAMDLPRPGDWDATQCDSAYRSGHSAFERGDYAQAVEHFASLLSACPHQVDYAMALALSAHRQGETKAALQLFMAAALMDETAPDPMYRVGECLIELGYRSEAHQAMQQTMQRCEGRPEHADLMNAARRSMATIDSAD